MSGKKYTHPAASDHGTVLEAHQVAVTYDEENGYQIMLPHHEEDDTMPEGAAVLVAVAMRLTDDPEFYAEMLEWFEERQRA